MTTLHTEAVVLRAVDFGESDRIVHLLTPVCGRLTVIAKGARRSVKRFPGTIDLANRLRVQVERRRRTSMARLEVARLVDPHLGLRERIGSFALACYLMEMIDRLAPEDGAGPEMQRLFGFTVEALAALDRLPPDRRLRIFLELRALEAVGLRPALAACVRCGAGDLGAGEVDFHVAEGGVVCADCRREHDPSLRVHPGTLRALEQTLRLDLALLPRLAWSRQALLEAGRLLHRFHRFHIGVELRSESFLEATLGDDGDRGRPSAPPD